MDYTIAFRAQNYNEIAFKRNFRKRNPSFSANLTKIITLSDQNIHYIPNRVLIFLYPHGNQLFCSNNSVSCPCVFTFLCKTK